jgi:hypothetical protein
MTYHFDGQLTTYPWQPQTRALPILASYSSNCGRMIPMAVAGQPCSQSQPKQTFFCMRPRRANVHSDLSRYVEAPSLPSLSRRLCKPFIFAAQEFYTPLPARSINFVHQIAADNGYHRDILSVVDTTKHHHGLGFDDGAGKSKSLTVGPVVAPRMRRISSPGDYTYGSQLSLFVIFEKKAGLIRIADSAVDEIEMYDDWLLSPITEGNSSKLRRSLQSFDAFGFGSERKGAWLPLCNLEVPTGGFVEDRTPLTRPIVLISRGRQTHILPSPIPVPLSSSPPLCIIPWNHTPSQVTGRVCYGNDGIPFLQVVAYGEGVEVAELDFSFLNRKPGSGGKGKGKAAPVEPLVRAYTDAFDPSRFACRGGEWHLLDTANGRPEIQRRMPSADSMDTREWIARVQMEEGFYGWYRKDVEDYRVFWMGNLSKVENDGMPELSRLSVREY